MANNLKLINDHSEELIFKYNPDKCMLLIEGFCSQTFFGDEAMKMQIIRYLDNIFKELTEATEITIRFTTTHLDSKVFKFFIAYLEQWQKKCKSLSFRLEIGKDYEVYCPLYNQPDKGFQVELIKPEDKT